MRLAGLSFQSQFPRWLFHLLFTNGNNGVSVFFAISGFLITSTSLRRFGALRNVNVRRFYRIRFARIAPLLVLVLLVLSILHLVHAQGFYILPSKATLPRALFAALTFHLNWLEAVRGYLPPNWDVLWSLSVEEVFYFFFPLVCLLTRVRAGRLLFSALLVCLVACGPFARTIWTANDIWREKSYLGGMDGIACGCLAALFVDWLVRRRGEQGTLSEGWLRLSTIAGAVILFFVALWPRWTITLFIGRSGLDGTLLTLGTCLIAIPAALKRASGRGWSEPLRWLGRNSYEVYMTHEFIVVWAVAAYAKSQAGPQSVWIIAIALLSSLLGALVARYYSEPLNRYLRGGGSRSRTVAIGQEFQKAI